MNGLTPLKQHHNWMCWQLQQDGDRLLKIPVDPKTGLPAACNDPSTWSSYDECKAYVNGGNAQSIGFVLTKEVGLVILDFDKVTNADGFMPPWVQKEIEELDSYTEISASGKGAHVLVFGSVPENYNRQAQHIEIWGFNKMFALSENIYEGRDQIETRDVSELHTRISRGEIGPDYKPRLILEKYDTPKFKDFCNDDYAKHGYADRSQVRMSILTTLASKFGDDVDAINEAFEKTPFGLIEIERGKWPRLAEREIDRAIQFSQDKQSASPSPVVVDLEFRKPRVPGTSFDFIVGPRLGFDEGWFPRGDVSIVGGASGVGKTTWMLDLLEKQEAGEKIEGRDTNKLPYFVLLEDRGLRDLERTLRRMRINMATFPHRRRNDMLPLAKDLQELLDSVDPTPAVVFVEGMDLSAADAKDSAAVSAVFKQIHMVADHYHCAIVGSFGSGKKSSKDQYTAKRDRIIGSTTWARKAITMAYVEKEGGKETDEVVVLTVMPRNAPAESFRKVFEFGRLVDAGPDPEAEAEDKLPTIVDLADWIRGQESFEFHDVEVAFPVASKAQLNTWVKKLEKQKLCKKMGKEYVVLAVSINKEE